MSSTAAVVVALQRLRLEISVAVLSPPFTQASALLLAVPWLKQGEAPGWKSTEDVVNNADVVAAALSVVRFVLLQRLAAGRKIEGSQRVSSSAGDDTPILLQPDRLKEFIDKHLQPLQGCTVHALQQVQIHQEERALEGAVLETFLALGRLDEVLDRTIENGNQLLQQYNAVTM